MILQEVFAPVDEIKPLSKEQMDEMDKARESDDYVTLQNNITVTKPIVVAKEITIDGELI